MEGEHLAAVCGTYCGACGLYRARRDNNPQHMVELLQTLFEQWQMPPDDFDCDGCLAGGRLIGYCLECKMRLCAAEKEGVTRCSDCPDFPCSIITDFNNDGWPHHALVLDKLRSMQEIGLEAWVKNEKEFWSCPQCQTPVAWYTKTCYECGTAQPNRTPARPRTQE